MDERDPVSAQQVSDFLKKSRIVWDADMLEHADRDDPIEPSLDLTIIFQSEAYALLQLRLLGTLLRDGQLLARERDADDLDPLHLGQGKREAAPPTADV